MSNQGKPVSAPRRMAPMSPGRRLAVASLLFSLSSSASATAQMPGETAGFVIQLGDDTIAVEQYRRSSHDLESELAVRVPFARRVHFLAALDTAGRVRRFDMTVRPLTRSAGPPATSTITFHRDSADLTLTIGDSVRRLRIPTRPGTVPLSAFSASLIELATIQAKRAKRDSVEFDWLALGSPEATQSYVAKRSKDWVAIGFLGNALLARVDGRGRILELDGRETTQKVHVTRVKNVNVGAFATAIAQTETASGPAGQLSPATRSGPRWLRRTCCWTTGAPESAGARSSAAWSPGTRCGAWGRTPLPNSPPTRTSGWVTR